MRAHEKCQKLHMEKLLQANKIAFMSQIWPEWQGLQIAVLDPSSDLYSIQLLQNPSVRYQYTVAIQTGSLFSHLMMIATGMNCRVLVMTQQRLLRHCIIKGLLLGITYSHALIQCGGWETNFEQQG